MLRRLPTALGFFWGGVCRRSWTDLRIGSEYSESVVRTYRMHVNWGRTQRTAKRFATPIANTNEKKTNCAFRCLFDSLFCVHIICSLPSMHKLNAPDILGTHSKLTHTYEQKHHYFITCTHTAHLTYHNRVYMCTCECLGVCVCVCICSNIHTMYKHRSLIGPNHMLLICIYCASFHILYDDGSKIVFGVCFFSVRQLCK